MRNPFTLQPKDVPIERNAPEEWADNWLSNFMAFVSLILLDSWCKDADHWTARITEYLFTTCPCCLLWRGLSVGALLGCVLGFLVGRVL